MNHSIGIIGGGLIGGSLALAINKAHPKYSLHLVSRRIEHIKTDPKSKIFSTLSTSISELPKNLDIAIVCTPIQIVTKTIQELSDHLDEDCIITDVASVKEPIDKFVSNKKNNRCIIPGHPMAGKEVTGFAHASQDLFDNAPYFLVPQKHPKYSIFKTFLNSLNCNVIEINAPAHDALMASISHVPYLAAIALVLSATTATTDSVLKQTFGPGYRDCTRVASSAPLWGEDICTHNKDALLSHLDTVISTLSSIKHHIQNNDTKQLSQLFEKAKSSRDQLNV